MKNLVIINGLMILALCQPLFCMDNNPRKTITQLNTKDAQDQEKRWMQIALEESLKTFDNLTITQQQTPPRHQVFSNSLIDFSDIEKTNNTTTTQSDAKIARMLQEQADQEFAQEMQQRDNQTQHANSNPTHTTTTSTKSMNAPKTGQTLRGGQLASISNNAKATHSAQNNIQVESIKALPQKGATCGIHAGCNALAMYTQVITGQTLHQQGLQALCNNYLTEWNALLKNEFSYLPKENVDNFEIGKVLQFLCKKKEHAATLKDAKFFFYGRYKDNPITFLGGIFPSYGDFQHDMQRYQHQFKSDSDHILNFIYNTGGHWVTVCAIKQNNKITLYFVDSANGTSNQAKAFIDYLKTILQ